MKLTRYHSLAPSRAFVFSTKAKHSGESRLRPHNMIRMGSQEASGSLPSYLDGMLLASNG